MFVAMHPGRPVKLLVEHLEAADIDPLLRNRRWTEVRQRIDRNVSWLRGRNGKMSRVVRLAGFTEPLSGFPSLPIGVFWRGRLGELHGCSSMN